MAAPIAVYFGMVRRYVPVLKNATTGAVVLAIPSAAAAAAFAERTGVGGEASRDPLDGWVPLGGAS